MALTMILASSVGDQDMCIQSTSKADSVPLGTGPSPEHSHNDMEISRPRNINQNNGNQPSTIKYYCERKLVTSFKQFCESFNWNDSFCGFFLGFLPTAWDLYTDFMFGGNQEVSHNLNSLEGVLPPPCC